VHDYGNRATVDLPTTPQRTYVHAHRDPHDDPPRSRERTASTPIATLGQPQRSQCWRWICCDSGACTHRAPIALAPFVIPWGPDASSDMLHRDGRAPCADIKAQRLDSRRGEPQRRGRAVSGEMSDGAIALGVAHAHAWHHRLALAGRGARCRLGRMYPIVATACTPRRLIGIDQLVGSSAAFSCLCRLGCWHAEDPPAQA